MLCSRCGSVMAPGIAIKPAMSLDEISIMPVGPINAQDLRIIRVMKCPDCGHSDYIDR